MIFGTIQELFHTRREQTRERVHDLPQQLESARQWAHHSMERTAWFEFFFADGYYHQLARQLDNTIAKAKRFNGQALSTLDDIIANWHQPEKSHARADQWREIARQANAVGQDVAASKSRVGSHWQGQAADKYMGILDPQSRAAHGVGRLAHHASAACDDMGKAVTAYNAGVLAAYNKYVSGMRFGMYMLADNPQFGMWELMNTIMRLSHDVGDLRKHLKALQDKRAKEFSQVMSSHTGFASNGKWPDAVRDRPATPPELHDHQVHGLGPEDIVRLRGRLIHLLSPQQLHHVVAEQIHHLLPHQVQHLIGEQIHHLQPHQIQHAIAEQVHHFLPAQIPFLTTEQLAHVQPHQIQHLTPDQALWVQLRNRS